jgi:hypothetical protein
VVTDVDITPSAPCATGWSNYILSGNNSLAASMMWTLSAPNTGHYTLSLEDCARGRLYSADLFFCGKHHRWNLPWHRVNLIGYLTSN